MKFGIFTDTHYAEKAYADRYCRDSLEKLEQAVGTFNSEHADFMVNMGDSIDGDPDKSAELRYLQKTSNILAGYSGPHYCVLGNHDLATLTKDEFIAGARTEVAERYYAFDIDTYHFVVLDGNYNEDQSDYGAGNFQWDRCIVSKMQLEWLRSDLSDAAGTPTVVFIHENLDYRTYQDDLDPHVVRNYQQVQAVLEAGGNVSAVFQGHCHTGRYSFLNGIHYITLSAMVVGPGVENNSYALVELCNGGGIEVVGYGRQISLSLPGRSAQA